MLFQPSNISPDEINGSGCVDITEGLAVTWQVSGDSAMTAYKVDIYNNNAASTLIYSTGRTALAAPFWGINYKGEQQYFTAEIPAAALSEAGMVNGGEYKLLISQWWSAEDLVQQATASLFLTRSAPTVTMDTIPSPLSGKAYSFAAVYTQAQGDPIKWVRWQLAQADETAAPFVDTGNITGTGELRLDYDGFFTGEQYAVRCTVETANGIQASSGWVDFTVSYTVGPAIGQVEAQLLPEDGAVFVKWTQLSAVQGYAIYRRRAEDRVLTKIAEVDSTTGQLRDYAVRSGSSYVYYVFPAGSTSYVTEPLVSETVCVRFWFWKIIEANETENGYFAPVQVHLFKVGMGGVSENEFSNNNAPTLQKNFTRYPTRQPETANYLSGSVSGYIGTVSRAAEYTDTVRDSDRVFKLSTTENALFLADPKGHFLRIHTAQAVMLSIGHANAVMPQTMTIHWAETDSAESAAVILAPGGEFNPADEVILTSLHLELSTGALVWTVPPDYTYGSTLSLNAAGALVQTAEGEYAAADMQLNAATGVVTATI